MTRPDRTFPLDGLGVTIYRRNMSQPDREPIHARCYSNSAPQGGWAVAQTYGQAEHWADANLRQQGYVTFLPLCLVLRRDRVLRSMTRPVEVPLFPGYLFVRYRRGENWRPIRETPGVAGLLHNGDDVPYAPETAVSVLQATAASRRIIDAPGPLWRSGTPCRLAGGAFAGHDAVVLRVEREVAVVALVCFGAMREAIVARDLLAPRQSAC